VQLLRVISPSRATGRATGSKHPSRDNNDDNVYARHQTGSTRLLECLVLAAETSPEGGLRLSVKQSRRRQSPSTNVTVSLWAKLVLWSHMELCTRHLGIHIPTSGLAVASRESTTQWPWGLVVLPAHYATTKGIRPYLLSIMWSCRPDSVS